MSVKEKFFSNKVLQKDKDELLQAMVRGARWIIDVVQVKNEEYPMFGALRNNYNTKTKEWEFYEPFWHTGQAIRALVAAYRLTGKEEFLDGALKGARYMEGLQFNDRIYLDAARKTGEW